MKRLHKERLIVRDDSGRCRHSEQCYSLTPHRQQQLLAIADKVVGTPAGIENALLETTTYVMKKSSGSLARF